MTLIELLITVTVVGIITIVSSNLYRGYVMKGRRIDAVQILLEISMGQERYRSTHTTYGTLAQVWTGTSSAEGYYTISVSNVSATSYTITATANGTQANDNASGTSCAALVLAVSNGAITKTPAACWPS